MDVSFDKLQELLPSQPSLFNYVHDLNWRERKLPPSGRGVSEPLQLKCLAHIGSAGPNETIPEGTVGSDVVEMSEASNKAPNRK